MTRHMRSCRRSADMDKARSSMTPLHIGAYWGHFTIVQLLCERGANPLLQTTTRKLPVDLVPPEAQHDELRAYLTRITAAAQLTEKDGLTIILNGIAIVAVWMSHCVTLSPVGRVWNSDSVLLRAARACV